MLEVDSIVEATITKIWQHGLELGYEGQRISVRVTDIAEDWQASKQKLSVMRLGQSVLVRITYYAEHHDAYLGTLTGI